MPRLRSSGPFSAGGLRCLFVYSLALLGLAAATAESASAKAPRFGAFDDVGAVALLQLRAELKAHSSAGAMERANASDVADANASASRAEASRDAAGHGLLLADSLSGLARELWPRVPLVPPMLIPGKERMEQMYNIVKFYLLLAVFLLVFYLVGLAIVGQCSASEFREVIHTAADLTVSFVLVTIAFCGYGVIQEYIMTQDYGGEKFPSVAFLIFANRVFILTFSVVALLVQGQRPMVLSSGWAAFPAATVFLSSWCQHSSLRYISFPTQVVFKSSKIVPTMFVNTVLNGQHHGLIDYTFAFIISMCVAGFTLTTDISGDPHQSNSVVGALLMFSFLLCDSLTSNSEKRIYENNPNLTATQMMIAVGSFSFLYSLVTVHSTVSFGAVSTFLKHNPQAAFHVIGLSICSTFGQYLTFRIIRRHGPVTFSVMMTVRQVFSVVISTIAFGHAISFFQACCALSCFSCLLLKPLVKRALSCSRPKGRPGSSRRAAH